MSAAHHLPYVAALRGLGSTTPTAQTPRPSVGAWSCSRSHDGHEQWTWVLDGVPLVSVLARDGEVAPVHVTSPLTYRLPLETVERAAGALVELCRMLGARQLAGAGR